MKITFAPIDVLPTTSTLVLLTSVEGQLGSIAKDFDKKTDGAIERAIDLAGSKFKRSSIDLVCPKGTDYDRFLVVPIDDHAEGLMVDIEALGGRIAQKLNALDAKNASILIESTDGVSISDTDLALALAMGIRLRDYRFNKYRTTSDDDDADAHIEGMSNITFYLRDHDQATAAWVEGEAIAAGVEHGRDLVTEPANVLTPAAFADHCRKLHDEVGLEVEVLDQADLERLGMRALLGVAQGSVNEPYVAVMNWKGGAEGEPPVALVGKGVCFDTGGISLKPSGGMEEMKWDMGGAAAVFGAIKAIAGRKAKANVVAVLGLVENMPSGTAQRPGDVVKAMSGTTIEVINTDAEGRLVLADALHYTIGRFKPKAIGRYGDLDGGCYRGTWTRASRSLYKR